MDKYIDEIEQTGKVENDNTIIVGDGREMKSIRVDNLVESFWNMLYSNFKKVIITCSHCNSANAITNSNCISCGAPLGKDIQRS